jgi:putative hydrolase of the HAD superfamily
MYRAIIYDLDGVIRHWDEPQATRALEERHGLPPGAIAAAVFEPSLLERALTGHISDETWRLAARNALVRTHGPTAGVALDRWSERVGRVDPAMTAFVAWVRRRLRTGLLTNATTRLETDLAAVRLDQAFDVVVNSARIGFAKPDPRIYRVAAARLGFPPAQCLYVDDTPAHVTAARECGMHAVRFEGVAALEGWLHDLGLLPAADG